MHSWFPNLLLLAQEGADAAKQEAPQGSLLMMAPLMIGLFVVYYVVVMRPQSREREVRESFRESLRKNDKVVTIGGIVGKVATSPKKDDRFVILEMHDGARVKMLKTAIQGHLDKQAESDATADTESEELSSTVD